MQEPSPAGPFVPEIDEASSVQDQALALVRAGLKLCLVYPPVFNNLPPPTTACACKDGAECGKKAGKHPIGANWQRGIVNDQDVYDAFTSVRFKQTPNLGIVLGDQPSGAYIVAIDVDDAARLASLQIDYGELPETAASESARGKKLFYSIPSTIDRSLITNKTGLGGSPGVDVKVQNGQVVAPPSVHAVTGKPYVWVKTGVIAELPAAWIFELLKKPNVPQWAAGYTPELLKSDRKKERKAQQYFNSAVVAESNMLARIGQGLRNDTLFKAVCRILPLAYGLGLGPSGHRTVVSNLSSAARAAGLPPREIAATIRSAEKKVEETGSIRVPEFMRVIEGGAGKFTEIEPPSGSPDAVTTGSSDGEPAPPPQAAPATLIPPPLTGADRMRKVTDLRRLSQPWMKDLIWIKRSEGSGENKEEWFVPKSCLANGMTIMRKDERWNGVIARNDFSEAEVMLKPPPWHENDGVGAVTGPWADVDTSRLVAWFERAYEMALRPQDVDRIVAMAGESFRFHPVREYLNSVVWDKVPRLDNLLPYYFGSSDTEYARSIGPRWMISAVARVMAPGCQVDCTLVLEGNQGIGKNRGMRMLVPDPLWFTETRIEMGNKDGFQSLRGKWIVFLDELDSLRKAHISLIKSFLTSPKDHYRESYGTRSRDFWRQCVFAGSTNLSEWLIDPTGNRRFWPIKLARPIQFDAIVRDRDQLWAEARVRYQGRTEENGTVIAPEEWHVNTPELKALCEEEQEERVQEDPWTPRVASWLANPLVLRLDGANALYPISGGVLTVDIATMALGIETGKVTAYDCARIGNILRKFGFRQLPLAREGLARVRRWLPPT
jgi:predicted P-loop ATPase